MPDKILKFIQKKSNNFTPNFFKHTPAQPWNAVVDDQNRVVNCCNNWQTQTVKIDKITYTVLRIGFDVYLYIGIITYLDLTMETKRSQEFIEQMNVQPDYSKEYWKNRKADELIKAIKEK